MCRYLSKIVSNKAIFNFMDIFKAISQDVIDSYFEKIVQVIRTVSLRNEKTIFTSQVYNHTCFVR